MKSRAPKIKLFFAATLMAVTLDAASAAKVHRGSCGMDICTWYGVEDKAVAASNSKSTLFKVTLKTWTSKHPGGAYDKKARRVGGDVISIYFSCSKTKPAEVESANGKWTATFLDLYEPPGYQQLAVMEYFVVCHGFDIDESKSGFDAAARKFGYRKISNTPDAIELDKPEDILAH